MIVQFSYLAQYLQVLCAGIITSMSRTYDYVETDLAYRSGTQHITPK